MLYISYTREDALLTTQLVEDLGELGIEVWFDLNEIEPGMDWDVAQSAAIEACEGVIVVLSPEALQREHMRREVELAFQREKPVYLAVARRIPRMPWMRGLPYADFTREYQHGLDMLVIAITDERKHGRAETTLDPAEEFLRQAEGAPKKHRKNMPAAPAQKAASDDSWLSKALKRLL